MQPTSLDHLRLVYYEDTVGPADWNDGKPAPIVRFIARKEQKGTRANDRLAVQRPWFQLSKTQIEGASRFQVSPA